jgi:hypothetical protein
LVVVWAPAASRGPTWPSQWATERRPRGSCRSWATTASANAPGTFIIRSCCEHEGPEADGRGGRTDDWRPVPASPRSRPASLSTRPRHGFMSKRRPSSTRQRHTAAWPPPISKGPRCREERRTPGRRWGISARQNCGWRNRLVPTAARRASRACAEDHQRPVTGGTYDSRCRRLGSPQSSREVPAETQTAVTGRGTGNTAEGSVFGGPVWPLEVPLRDAVAHRLRPVGISAQARSVTAGAGLAFRVPGTRIGRPSPNEPAAVVHRVSVKVTLAALVPSGPLTVGRWCARGSSRARASCWLASRAVLGRYVAVSSGVVKPSRMSQV